MTSGYSGTPLAAKLGIKAGHRVLLIGASQEWSIHDLPESVRVGRRRGASRADVVIAFLPDAASLDRGMVALSDTITADGALWIAWPRKAAGHVSDLTDNAVRNAALPLGLVDVKVAALDEDWSALKMVWRKELRAGRR
jgi:3-hydroxyisobutyrate dehydrogenase-like beta-hydroxyacid dehydrogenase